ncbi:dihydrodipicolinate synthase family protein [Pelosinus propionicus]|uniref:4-hydroxy-tetrahydrodipicolinate synthase n=1 Tax=Pelosinus propionicus DSM 13327 TaxID=1123291 RepID=A0A1I4KJU7_9FIRM|nr:dihydrodipicolinate synthase family protein [Pelosinus propionicus]SFL78863.1 4-hydroxy-tetrahydrodipicolinate synthase [Pelosinus propionicus DSM 13327]
MKKKIIGVIPPIITPVDENENVDEKGLRKLVRRCIDTGIHGIFVAGSNGETMALTQKERNRAIQITLDEAKEQVPVICGVMDASTRRVIENIKELEQMGGKVAVVTPVFYARHATQDETVRHFEEIARQTEIDLMIYNIPPFTGQTLTPQTIFKIAKIDKVIGYKDTTGRFPDFLQCLEHFKGTDFVLHQGATNLAAASLLLGADGYIPSMAPLYPKPFIKLFEYGQKGDIQKTKFYDHIVSLTSAIWPMAKSQTASTKYALSKLGFDHRVVQPSESITNEQMKAIDKKMAEIEKYLAENDLLN